MKNGWRMAILTLTFASGLSVAEADTSSSDDNTPDPRDPVANLAKYDPTIQTQQVQKQPTAREIAAAKQQAQAAQRDSDWLLRAYNQQVRANDSRDPSGEDNNLMNRISSDRELAKIAGVEYIDRSGDMKSAILHTGTPGAGGKSVLNLRDSGTSPKGRTPVKGAPLQPLITPMTATQVAGLNNFFTAPPGVASMLYPSNPTPHVTQPKLRQSPEAIPDPNANIETPGMLAAQSDPFASSVDLHLDLPTESQNLSDPASTTTPQLDLTLTSNLELVKKQDSVAMRVPGKTSKPAPAPLKALPVEPPATDAEMVKVTPPIPARSQLSDPRDFDSFVR